MKRIFPVILVLFFLCGCATVPTKPGHNSGEASAPSAETVMVPEIQTSDPAQTTTATLPPDPLEALLKSLSLEERVGQLFLARCPDRNAAAEIEKYHLGGYILFARDFQDQTPASVSVTIQSYQTASKIPMLIAVDEEGGTVTRVSCYTAFRNAPFDSPRNLYAQGGLVLIADNETEKCQLLRSLGINVNMGPVCDVTTNPGAFMYQRSLGQSPEITGAYVSTVIGTMHDGQIGCVLKHFPGYGNNTDTHVAVAVDERPLSQLEEVDLLPFAAGIAAGCDAIMVSHVYINALDPETPATLSPAVHHYLRKNMGFDGVIVTDDLAMRAITDVYGVGESAVLAVLAGNDLLCVTNYKQQYDAVLTAVRDGRISEEFLNQAVLRILRWKQALGLI